MKIISVRQPRAALIVNGLKDIENRTSRTNYRGALLIQASLRADDITADEIERRFGVRLSDDLARGGIVGVAEIVDCVRDHPSRWFNNGCWGFLLANARPLPLVEWRGALALRDAPRELLTMLFGSDQKEAVAEATAQFAWSPFRFLVQPRRPRRATDRSGMQVSRSALLSKSSAAVSQFSSIFSPSAQASNSSSFWSSTWDAT
jgi:hypothetical protein